MSEEKIPPQFGVPHGSGVGLYEIRDRWRLGSSPSEVEECLEALIKMMDAPEGVPREARLPRRMVLCPDYQRGLTWTPGQAESFAGFWLQGGECPKIWVHRSQSVRTGGREYWDTPCEVIDGQQRLTALRSWVRGEINALLDDGRRVAFKDTDKRDRAWIPGVKICYVDLVRADRMRLYIRLNRGGTAHTDAEIEAARRLLAEEESKGRPPRRGS